MVGIYLDLDNEEGSMFLFCNGNLQNNFFTYQPPIPSFCYTLPPDPSISNMKSVYPGKTLSPAASIPGGDTRVSIAFPGTAAHERARDQVLDLLVSNSAFGFKCDRFMKSKVNKKQSIV